MSCQRVPYRRGPYRRVPYRRLIGTTTWPFASSGAGDAVIASVWVSSGWTSEAGGVTLVQPSSSQLQQGTVVTIQGSNGTLFASISVAACR
jgi:hypothetical protein